MTADELFDKLDAARERKEAAYDKMMVCDSMAKRVTSALGDERVSRSRNMTAHEDAMIRLMQAKDAYNAREIEYNQIVAQINDLICQVKGSDRRKTLIDFCINQRSMKDIAVDLHFSKRQTQRVFNAAYQALDELLKAS